MTEEIVDTWENHIRRLTPRHDSLFLFIMQRWKELVLPMFECDDENAEFCGEIGVYSRQYAKHLFPDACIFLHGHLQGIDRIIIEIKPWINSFGQTLRQLQKYKSIENAAVVLVTYDKWFTHYFERQGFKVLILSPVDAMEGEV